MSGALFAIEQDRPGGPSTTPAGHARNDLWIDRLLHFILASPLGNTVYLWELLDAPAGSSAVIIDPNTDHPSLQPDVYGPYRIRCIVNGGGPNNIAVLICLVRYDFSGVLLRHGRALPAFGETEAEDGFDAGGVALPRGYAKTFEELEEDTRARLEALEAAGGGFTAGGDLSGSSSSQTVEKIHGTSVPATTGTDAGKVLTADGLGATTWETPGGGGSLSGDVTGALGSNNVTTFNQAEVANDGCAPGLGGIAGIRADGKVIWLANDFQPITAGSLFTYTGEASPYHGFRWVPEVTRVAGAEIVTSPSPGTGLVLTVQGDGKVDWSAVPPSTLYDGQISGTLTSYSSIPASAPLFTFNPGSGSRTSARVKLSYASVDNPVLGLTESTIGGAEISANVRFEGGPPVRCILSNAMPELDTPSEVAMWGDQWAFTVGSEGAINQLALATPAAVSKVYTRNLPYGNAVGIVATSTHLFVVGQDGADGKITALTWSNIANMTVVDTVTLTGVTVNDICTDGTYLYIATSSGMYVYQLVATTLTEVAPPGCSAYSGKICMGATGYVVVSGGDWLYWVDVTTPSSPSDAGSAQALGSVVDMAPVVSAGKLVVASHRTFDSGLYFEEFNLTVPGCSTSLSSSRVGDYQPCRLFTSETTGLAYATLNSAPTPGYLVSITPSPVVLGFSQPLGGGGSALGVAGGIAWDAGFPVVSYALVACADVESFRVFDLVAQDQVFPLPTSISIWVEDEYTPTVSFAVAGFGLCDAGTKFKYVAEWILDTW